jgi:hypothetical protein
MDERLRDIELKLDELLEQPYRMALGTGGRYLLEVGVGRTNRAHDLDRARDAFIEATAAARSSLQEAIAERYLLLTTIAHGQHDLVASSMARMEAAALATALDAVVLTEQNTAPAEELLRSRGVTRRTFGSDDRLASARMEVKSTALATIDMCGRLLNGRGGPRKALPLRLRGVERP